MKKLLLLSFLSIAAGAARATIWDVDFVNSIMTGTEEVPPNASPATGTDGGMTFDDASKILSVSADFSGLLAGSTAAHVHQAAFGVNGPVIIPLLGGGGLTSGTWSGAEALDPAEEAALNAGGLYLNIHSTLFPGGEIRGQLVVGNPIPEPEHCALLTVPVLIGWRLWRQRRKA